MTDKERKVRCGIFTVISLIILIVAIYFLGGREWFINHAILRTEFKESVKGLTCGSKVCYRGAPIGRVSKIMIVSRELKVQVDMEIDPQVLDMDYNKFRLVFRREVSRGLRCKMDLEGITGAKYIDFDYYAAPGEVGGVKLNQRILYIPSVNSMLTDVMGTVRKICDTLSQINIAEMADTLKSTIEDIAKIAADPSIKIAINEAREVIANLNTVSTNFSNIFEAQRLDHLLKDIESAVSKINNEVEKAKVGSTMESFRSASGAVVEAKQDLHETLFQLNQTMGEVRQLMEYLNRDPNALLNGKKASPVFK